MAHRKVQGADWFIHSLVVAGLLESGAARYGVEIATLRTLISPLGVLVICDAVPIKYDGASETYSGGWSQTIDETCSVYRFLMGT